MKFIIITLFAFFLTSNLNAQEYEYTSFPDSNAVWSEIHWKSIFEPSPQWVYYQNILFNEDTVINNIFYHKLYTSGNSEPTKKNSKFTGGIREDSLKRVWIKFDSAISIENKNCNEYGEFLLYDFNLKVGDSFTSFGLSLNNGIVFVQKVDTINVNNTLRKRFLFGNDIEIIEGIGNVQGLLICSPDWPTNGMHNDLICFHHNDTLLYFNTYYDDCVPSFVIDEVSVLAIPDIKVYPNPVKGEVVYFENLDFETLELFDLNGNLVREETIKGLNVFELKIPCISSGVYTYRLTTKGLVPTQGKLVVQ